MDINDKRAELKADLLDYAKKYAKAKKRGDAYRAGLWKGYMERTEDWLSFLDALINIPDL